MKVWIILINTGTTITNSTTDNFNINTIFLPEIQVCMKKQWYYLVALPNNNKSCHTI